MLPKQWSNSRSDAVTVVDPSLNEHGRTAGEGQSAAVTKIVDRIPRVGAERELEDAIRQLNAAAAQCPGYLGVTVTKPAPPSQPGFRVVYRFESLEHLTAWEESQRRMELLFRANEYTVGEPRMELTRGLETWLTLPPGRPPNTPRLRLAFVSWLGIFPLVVAFVALAEIVLPASTHRLVSLGLVTVVVVILMTYLVGPALTRVFRTWLQRKI